MDQFDQSIIFVKSSSIEETETTDLEQHREIFLILVYNYPCNYEDSRKSFVTWAKSWDDMFQNFKASRKVEEI